MPKKQFTFASANRQSILASSMNNLMHRSSNEPLIGLNGEINAGSKAELLQITARLAEIASQHAIVTDQQATNIEEATIKREMVTAAFQSNEELIALGEVLADDLQVTANREGFMRRFLAYQELDPGQIPQVRMNMKNITAVVAVGPTQTQTQLTRDNTMYPDEFYITARPYIEQRDIVRTSGDLLTEKYNEALEATMVAEDRLWKKMADQTVNLENEFTNISGLMNPQALSALANQVTRWGIPAQYCFMANDLWQDLVGDAGFQRLMDPVSQFEILQTGKLGTIFGMEMLSDQYRYETRRVLTRGDLYVVGAPENHGQYTDRGGLDVQPIDGTQEKIPGRGWVMNETMSMIIANARSVAKARRVR